jgi:hypothetical protein
MSLYNLVNGVKPAVFLVLPMLGKHPDEYPRFRNCFLGDQKHPEYADHIHVFTRTGGPNREDYVRQHEEMRRMEGFVTDYDDDDDNTFASWVFRVPARWQADYDKLKAGDVGNVSAEYQAELRRVYPKLVEMWDKLFSSVSREAGR